LSNRRWWAACFFCCAKLKFINCTPIFSIIRTSSENIYTVGSSNSNWIVRKSTDAGSIWNTIDTFASSSAADLALDSSNNIFVVGTDQTSWFVRKSTDDGANWSTVDKFQFSTTEKACCSPASVAQSIIIDLSDNVYVSGYAQESSGKGHWLVRKSTDGGKSWTTVDDYSE